MKLTMLFIGIILGALTAPLYYRLASPVFWSNSVEVIEVHFESAVIAAFKTEQGKEAAFLIHKGARCYRMDDKSSSFARIDPKDFMILNKFVICPGLGAGWVKGL
jgi:hypothetical protein